MGPGRFKYFISILINVFRQGFIFIFLYVLWIMWVSFFLFCNLLLKSHICVIYVFCISAESFARFLWFRKWRKCIEEYTWEYCKLFKMKTLFINYFICLYWTGCYLSQFYSAYVTYLRFILKIFKYQLLKFRNFNDVYHHKKSLHVL